MMMMVKSTLICCCTTKRRKKTINYTVEGKKKQARILLHHRTMRGKYPDRDGDSVTIKTRNKILADLGFCSVQHRIWYSSMIAVISQQPTEETSP